MVRPECDVCENEKCDEDSIESFVLTSKVDGRHKVIDVGGECFENLRDAPGSGERQVG